MTPANNFRRPRTSFIISNSAVDQQEALFRRLLTLAVTLAIITPGLLAIIPIALL